MTVAALLLGGTAVFVGAATQRLTGLGFALVAAPFLVLAAGPGLGVGIGNVLSALVCLLVLARTWREARWGRVLLLAVPALLVIPFGAMVQQSVPEGPLMVLIGGLSILAIILVAASRRAAFLRGRAGAAAAGGLSGFMNVTAGLGGPPVAIHAVSEGWTAAVMVPTSQAFLLTVNIASLAAKGWPPLPPRLLVGAVALTALGAAVGGSLASHVHPETVRRLLLAVALLGGAAAVLRGALLW